MKGPRTHLSQTQIPENNQSIIKLGSNSGGRVKSGGLGWGVRVDVNEEF